MRASIRTDMAYERGSAAGKIPGAEYEECNRGPCRLHTLRVATAAAAKKTGCRRGIYRTLFFRPVWAMVADEEMAVSEELSRLMQEWGASLLGGEDFRGKRILVAGLGNRDITADAVGPRAADKINATAHLRENRPSLLRGLGCAELAVLAPGVMAQSGMESAALIGAAAKAFSPHLVITVDALCARAFSRLGSTVQLSDAGVEPGSGIGNRRAALNREFFGCPVLSVGVPTVTDTATLVYDALEQAGMPAPEGNLRRAVEAGREYFISPRETDVATEKLSDLISYAINSVFGFSYS